MTNTHQTNFCFTLSDGLEVKPASHFQKFTLKRKQMKSSQLKVSSFVINR